MATLGREVQVSGAGEVLRGVAMGVDVDGALLVETPEGAVQRVVAGDVTLRKESP
jgi:BirA family biotin operon repressor/biotin-[acetyl-CoA-carboxylase] ligase